MAIRVAGSTFAFGKIDLEESCKIMQEMGFDVVDVGACGMSTFTDYVPQWFITDLDDTQGEADHIRRTTEKYGLEIAELFCCDFGVNINDPDPKKREASQQTYEKVAKIAAAAGFNSIMMLPGMIDEDNGQTFDQAFDTSVSEYKRMVAVAEGLGIHCNIEPCIFSVAWQPENAIKLCEAVPRPGAHRRLRPPDAAQPQGRRHRAAPRLRPPLPGQAVRPRLLPGQARRGLGRLRTNGPEDARRRL